MLVAAICATGALGIGLVAGGAPPVAETGAAASPGGASRSARTTASRTQVLVEPQEARGPISPLLYGVNHRYAYHGFGMWDTANDRAYPEFVDQVERAGLTAVRYPGGTIANLFRWKRAIGPLSERERSPHGTASLGEPLTAEFGPDEFGRFVERVGASGSVVVNFATGDADEAADWVEYMTAPLGTNPSGGTAWAEVRAANGHPEPYDVPYWEVANEPYLPAQQYWMAGDSDRPVHELYAFGGSTRFSGQPVGTYDDHSPAAAVSDGTPSQVFYAKYPPVAPGSQTVSVDGATWRQTDDVEASGREDVYELDPETGRIAFGDGTHGNVPPEGAVITISYESGPHDGFVDFYREMKEANPDVRICAALHFESFIEAMGATHPYDCMVRHPYVGRGDVSNDLDVEEYHSQFLAQPETKAASVAETQAQIREHAGPRAGDVSVVVSEYGHLANANPRGVEHYHRSLDEGLYNAEFIRQMIELGIPVALRHSLTDYVFAEPPDGSTAVGAPDNAVISGPAPHFTSQGQAHVFALYTQMFGDRHVRSRVLRSPERELQNGGRLQALTSVASTDEAGNVYVIAINRDPERDVPAEVLTVDYRHSGVAEVWTVNGPSYSSYNTPDEPDRVTIAKQRVAIGASGFDHTFPAHSVTAIKLRGGVAERR